MLFFRLPKRPTLRSIGPGGAPAAEGWPIIVGDIASAQRYDFRLPTEIQSETLNGQVLLPDGKPASGAKVWLACCDSVETVDADADGRFSLRIMEGLKYTLNAGVNDPPREAVPVPVSFGNLQNSGPSFETGRPHDTEG